MGAAGKCGRFEVTGHFELSGRGAFVIGRIRAGVIGIGMRIDTGLEPSSLTISAVESVDRLSTSQFWNALLFAERPSLELIERAFPVGSIVEVTRESRDRSSREDS